MKDLWLKTINANSFTQIDSKMSQEDINNKVSMETYVKDDCALIIWKRNNGFNFLKFCVEEVENMIE